MEEIKIRFIEYRIDNIVTKYTLQRKNLLGWWKDYRYTIDMGYGSVEYYYENADKKALLQEILEKYHKTCFPFVQFREYPDVIIHRFTKEY